MKKQKRTRKPIEVEVERIGKPNYKEIAEAIVRIDTYLKAIGK